MSPEQREAIIDDELVQLVREHRQALHALFTELEYQRRKWGPDKQQSLPGYLLILESELREAKHGWIKDLGGRSAPLAEIVQIAAVAVACLTRYGTSGSAGATNDLTEDEMREARLAASEQKWGSR